jgi:hypothetical protein
MVCKSTNYIQANKVENVYWLASFFTRININLIADVHLRYLNLIRLVSVYLPIYNTYFKPWAMNGHFYKLNLLT